MFTIDIKRTYIKNEIRTSGQKHSELDLAGEWTTANK